MPALTDTSASLEEGQACSCFISSASLDEPSAAEGDAAGGSGSDWLESWTTVFEPSPTKKSDAADRPDDESASPREKPGAVDSQAARALNECVLSFVLQHELGATPLDRLATDAAASVGGGDAPAERAESLVTAAALARAMNDAREHRNAFFYTRGKSGMLAQPAPAVRT